MSIKNSIKSALFNLGIWYSVERIRQRNAIQTWIANGMTGAAPHALKIRVVKSYLDRYSLDRFVETGTYEGATLGFIANTGVNCVSIELSEELYSLACEKFRKYSNVRLIHGDSAEQLPHILGEIDQPTLFWLDGHYSAGVTARGQQDTPISEELQAIFTHPVQGHVILIDDARCFDGTNGYPHLDKLLGDIRRHSKYDIEISTDIIRLTPRTLI